MTESESMAEGMEPEGGPAPLFSESPREQAQRLLHMEQALDNWYAASEKQEYARKESLEGLLFDYTRDHMEAIISDLKNAQSHQRRRRVMAAALGFSGHQEAVPALMVALSDPDYDVVEHALLSLYHLTKRDPLRDYTPDPDNRSPDGIFRPKALPKRDEIDPTTVDAEKVATFLQHHIPSIRSNAALALRPLLEEQDTPPNSVLLGLINAAEDQDNRTRVHAVAALGATRSPEVVPHLVKALTDPVPLVRIRAALGIGRSGDIQMAPYLIEVLDRSDESSEVKRFVVQSLRGVFKVSDAESLTSEPAYWRKLAKDRGVL